MPAKQDFAALRNMIDEAHQLLATTQLPEGRAERALELLRTALALVDDFGRPVVTVAAAMGKKGGKSTAKKMTAKDPDYYKKIAAMRKTKAGGRPKKDATS